MSKSSEIEIAQKNYMDGEFCLDIKRYLHHSGATELAERIHESTNQEQLKLIIENLVKNYEGKFGSRLYH